MHSILSGVRLPYDELSPDSESSEGSEGSDSGQSGHSSNNTTAEASGQNIARTELQQLQDSISSFVKNLYQISIIIRKNPAPHDRLVKSAKIDTSFFEAWDIRHVQEKYPQANQSLWETLGKANSRRRKYFLYREQHREKLSAPPDKGSKDVLEAAAQDGPDPQLVDVKGGRTIDETTPIMRQPTVAMESTTASTFVPPALPAPLDLGLFDQQSDTATQITTDSVSSVAQDHLSIPHPPKTSKDAAEFECPYCYAIFHFRSSDPWRRKKEWKRHVLRDLQPYSCTFRGCFQANTLYERRGDWMHHEAQNHRKEWSCNAAGHEVHKTRDGFKTHMNDQHNDSFDANQLDQIVDLMERPAIFSRFSCPLCYDERSADLDLFQLEKHLGRHLQILATFALPSVGSASRASNDSVAAQDSTPNGADTSQISDTVEAGALPTYHDRDDAIGPIEIADSSSVIGTGHYDEYPHELAVFVTNVGNERVTSQMGLRCLQEWDHEFLRSGPHMGNPLERPSRDHPSSYDIFGPGQNESLSSTADISIRDLFDGVLKLAADVLQKKRQPIGEDLEQFRTSLRRSLSDFAKIILAKMEPLQEQQADLWESLWQLPSQLLFNLPSEVSAVDEDWTFLHSSQSPPQETREASIQEEIDPIDRFCGWLNRIDRSAMLSNILRGMCPGTGSWLEEIRYFKDLRSTKSPKVLLVFGLRKFFKNLINVCILNNH